MLQIEQSCAGIGLTADLLMENAGKAVAEETLRLLGDSEQRRILLLVGPGNNGGDGLVAARYFHDRGVRVSVYLVGYRPPGDLNLGLVQERGIDCYEANVDEGLRELGELLASADAVIDALFGTGKTRPIKGMFQLVLDRVGRAKRERPELRVIALDLPSGLDADGGAADPACLAVDYTITLGFLKLGLFNSPDADRAGRITVADIGMPEYMAASVTTELITGRWAGNILPRRPPLANKGSFGKVLVLAGSINYVGAAYLAGSGAMRVGAGLVTLATAEALLPVLATKLTEATYLPLPESHPGIISPKAAGQIARQSADYDVLLMGCGLGQSPSIIKLFRSVLPRLRGEAPWLVLDADALNVLAQLPGWWREIANDAILTPHPGEMSRLSGVSVEAVQSDRLGVARKAAAEWQKTVVLKGAYTVIVAPDGRALISPTANPGLASAGTGDVLAGVIAGLLAQGLPLFEAAALGVYLHGEAGEKVKARLGDTGMVATDLLPELPLVVKRLKASSQ